MTPTFWRLVDFHSQMTAWIEREDPPSEFVAAVGDWIGDLTSDPYRAARRQTELAASMWFTRVPGAGDNTHSVTAFYEIDETSRLVRCHTIATLREPIV